MTATAREFKRPVAPPHITDLMFRDTVTARMLRKLCEIGRMTQAQFMREYIARCERPMERPCMRCSGTGQYCFNKQYSLCGACGGEGKLAQSKSSFHDNFGRFVHSTYECMSQDGILSKRTSKPSGRYTLTWTKGFPSELLRAMTDEKLHDAFTQMERQMLAPRVTDVEHETARWIQAIRTEMNRRAS